MTDKTNNGNLSRRSVLRMAALGAGSSLLAGGLPRVAHAQAPGDVAKAIEWAKANLPKSTPEIITAAAKEGKLTLTLQQFGDDETQTAMIKKFREHYPFIEVSYTQQNGAQIVNKFTAEMRAKRGVSDYLMLPSDVTQIDKYIAAGAFSDFTISQDSAFPDGTKRSGVWYPWLRQTNVTVYRKDAVTKEEKELLRTYKGLGDPRFKGKLGIIAAATSNGLTGSYILQKDPAIWNALVANKPIVKPSSGPLIDGLLAGEFNVALMSGYPTAALAAKNGAPLEFVISTPSPVLFAPGVISSLAPNPNAAKLWQDWGMSKEGQDLWVNLLGVPSVRSDVSQPWSEKQPWFFDDKAANKPMDWADFVKKSPEVLAKFQKDLQAS
jgi:ABC-type Fe3+ transport system substrate-binding protein